MCFPFKRDDCTVYNRSCVCFFWGVGWVGGFWERVCVSNMVHYGSSMSFALVGGRNVSVPLCTIWGRVILGPSRHDRGSWMLQQRLWTSVAVTWNNLHPSSFTCFLTTCMYMLYCQMEDFVFLISAGRFLVFFALCCNFVGVIIWIGWEPLRYPSIQEVIRWFHNDLCMLHGH